MRQYLVFPLILAAINLSGCFWNTKLPYQESMTTYVDSSQSLLVQVKAVSDYSLDICKPYRTMIYELNAASPDAEPLGVSNCGIKMLSERASKRNNLIDAAIAYHVLLGRHSAEGDESKTFQQIEATGKTVSEQCVKEGSRCNFSWVSGTRLAVLQATFGELFSAYANTQSHEALIDYLNETSDIYVGLARLLHTNLGEINAELRNRKKAMKDYFIECSENTSGTLCKDEELFEFMISEQDQEQSIESLMSQLKAHIEAHQTFKEEVMFNNTSEARKERLLDFAEGVLKTGFEVHQAF